MKVKGIGSRAQGKKVVSGATLTKKAKTPSEGGKRKKPQPIEDEMKEDENALKVEDKKQAEGGEPPKKQAKTEEAGQGKQKTTPFDAEKRLLHAKDQAKVALPSLRQYFEALEDKSLFPEIDQQLQLVVTYKKPDTKSAKKRKVIILPCSSRTLNNTTICIIMPDLEQSAEARRDVDVSKQAREWAAKLEEDHGITNKHYSLLLTHRQLKREYSQYKEKRDLANAYDVFLCDARVHKSVQSFLGKEFARAHKDPFIMRYEQPFATQIANFLKATQLPLGNFIHRLCIKFGDLRLSNADLSSNVDTLLDELAANAPGGWRNIRRVDVQPVGGKPSLPIYNDEGSANNVVISVSKAVAKRQKMKKREIVDECSTLPEGLQLGIRKNGKLRVLKESDKKRVLYPTIKDEWRSGETMKPKINPVKVEAKRKRRAALKKKRAEAAKQREAVKAGQKKQALAVKKAKKAVEKK